MLKLKIILLAILDAVACAQAGGAASVVAQKSTAKGFTYSYETREIFMNECTQGANRGVCRCVFGKIMQQYSETEYWRLENDLKRNVNHPSYVSYLTESVEQCDEEYSESSSDDTRYVLGGYRRYSRRSGGIGDGLAGLFGGGGGGISTKAKGNIKTPSARDIDMVAGGGSRSAADIMKVVRQRTPGLRHIYNKFLKKKPGFQGKVFLKFTIAPAGEVISISIASSTTGYGEFDAQIKNAVGNWTFSKVKSGNTTVAIPFTFSE
jgi:TonB family protein